MGLLDILAAGYLAKRANNKLNPPIIESPEDVTVIGVTAKGTNEYQIKFRKGNSSSWSSFRVTRNTRSRSGVGSFTGIDKPLCKSEVEQILINNFVVT